MTLAYYAMLCEDPLCKSIIERLKESPPEPLVEEYIEGFGTVLRAPNPQRGHDGELMPRKTYRRSK